MISDNHLNSIREFADDVDISFGSCQVIFMNVLSMKRTVGKIVPKLQNFERKQCYMDIAPEMFVTFNEDPDLLKKVITSEESVVYDYDIETTAQ